MVCRCCKTVVKLELEKLGLHVVILNLGEVEIIEDISATQKKEFMEALLQSELELMDDTKSILIEKVKIAILNLVYHSAETRYGNFSKRLSEELKYDYTYLSNLFSQYEGTTIEHYLIMHKIERVKELLIYDELSLKEVSYQMDYSSIAHLSNQFKKITGLTTSQFKKLKNYKRTGLPMEDYDMPNSSILHTG
jgi:AraC-like DNA-binding protein